MDKAVERLLEEYKTKIDAANAEYEQVIRSQPQLNERDRMLVEASSIRLIPVPAHLAQLLDDYDKMVYETLRLEQELFAEYGLVDDNQMSAYSFLRLQIWWPDFIKMAREELNITDADSVGRWQPMFKKIAPYIYDVALVFQSLQGYGDDKPVSSWTWRVNLRERTAIEV